jgi:hypothetical protein
VVPLPQRWRLRGVWPNPLYEKIEFIHSTLDVGRSMFDVRYFLMFGETSRHAG